MKQARLSPARLAMIAIGGVATYYVVFALLYRSDVQTPADHGMLLAGGAMAVGWIFLGMWTGRRFQGRSVGIRVTLLLGTVILGAIGLELLEQSLSNAIARRMVSIIPAILSLPLATGLFQRMPVEQQSASTG